MRAQETTAGDQKALLELLAGRDAAAGERVADRTRRAVRNSKLDRMERKEHNRYSTGLAVLVGAILLLLLAPSIWCSLEEFLVGEHISDLHAQLTLLVLLMFTAILAALFASRRTREGDGGQSRR